MMMTRCQDHISTENIWFVWSKTSYSGDKWRCNGCGTNDEQTREDRALSQWAPGRLSEQFRLIDEYCCLKMSDLHCKKNQKLDCSFSPLLSLEI